MNMISLVMALTVLTLNVNGIHDKSKWEIVWQEIPRVDIICFQETHLTKDQEFAFKLHAQGYNYWFSHGTSASAGVMIAISWLTGVNMVKVGGIPGWMLALDLTLLTGQRFQLINIYAPNNSAKCIAFQTDMCPIWVQIPC